MSQDSLHHRAPPPFHRLHRLRQHLLQSPRVSRPARKQAFLQPAERRPRRRFRNAAVVRGRLEGDVQVAVWRSGGQTGRVDEFEGLPRSVPTCFSRTELFSKFFFFFFQSAFFCKNNGITEWGRCHLGC